MHLYTQSFLLVYTKLESPGSDLQYQSQLYCFIYGPTNLKIHLQLTLYMPHNQSIYVNGDWTSSQLLGQKKNLKICIQRLRNDVTALQIQQKKHRLLESVGKILPDQ